MKKITQIIKGFLFVGFIFLMTNCATEEIGTQNVEQSSSEAKIWFETHEKDYKASVLTYIKELQWQDAIITDGISGQVIEVPFVLKDGLSVSNNSADLFNNHNRLMFIKNAQNEFNLFYVQIFTDQKSEKTLDKSYNYYNLQDDFDGAVYMQELKTNTKSRLEFKNGDRLQSSSQTAKSDQKMCLYYGYWYDDGHFEPLVEMGCYGSPEGTVGDRTSYGGGSGGSSSGPTEKTCPAGYQYKLGQCVPIYKITNLLTGKAKCLNDLLNKNGDSFVQSLLSNFEGTSKWDILIVSKDNVISFKDGIRKEANGRTLPPVDNLIGIEISTSKAETNSALDVARTILHEYIHADIFRKLGTKTSPTDTEGIDFKKTYDAYGEQHSTIAIVYLNSMKEALKKFHKTVLLDDYNKYTQYYGEVPSDAFYEALAWGGLRDADVKAWTDLPADKKAAIEALANRVPMLSKTAPCSSN